MRHCPHCNQTLPLSEFSLFLKRGKMLPRVHCKPCRVAIEKKRQAEKRGAPFVPPVSRGPVERSAHMAFMQWRGPVTAGLGARL